MAIIKMAIPKPEDVVFILKRGPGWDRNIRILPRTYNGWVQRLGTISRALCIIFFPPTLGLLNSLKPNGVYIKDFVLILKFPVNQIN